MIDDDDDWVARATASWRRVACARGTRFFGFFECGAHLSLVRRESRARQIGSERVLDSAAGELPRRVGDDVSCPQPQYRFAFRSLVATRSFTVRFGRSIVPTTRTVRGSPEHLSSSKARHRLEPISNTNGILNRYCGGTLGVSERRARERRDAQFRAEVRLDRITREQHDGVVQKACTQQTDRDVRFVL